MTFSSTCCMVFIGLSTTDTSGGFHSLQFHETTDKQASIQYMSHNTSGSWRLPSSTRDMHQNRPILGAISGLRVSNCSLPS